MNCDRGEKVSSYFKLEPQTQNKQIKNANGFSAEQMRPRCPDGASYNLTWGPSDESSGDTCQSIYLKTGKQLFHTSMNTPPRKMGIYFSDQFSAGFEPGDTYH